MSWCAVLCCAERNHVDTHLVVLEECTQPRWQIRDFRGLELLQVWLFVPAAQCFGFQDLLRQCRKQGHGPRLLSGTLWRVPGS